MGGMFHTETPEEKSDKRYVDLMMEINTCLNDCDAGAPGCTPEVALNCINQRMSEISSIGSVDKARVTGMLESRGLSQKERQQMQDRIAALKKKTSRFWLCC